MSYVPEILTLTRSETEHRKIEIEITCLEKLERVRRRKPTRPSSCLIGGEYFPYFLMCLLLKT